MAANCSSSCVTCDANPQQQSCIVSNEVPQSIRCPNGGDPEPCTPAKQERPLRRVMEVMYTNCKSELTAADVLADVNQDTSFVPLSLEEVNAALTEGSQLGLFRRIYSQCFPSEFKFQWNRNALELNPALSKLQPSLLHAAMRNCTGAPITRPAPCAMRLENTTKGSMIIGYAPLLGQIWCPKEDDPCGTCRKPAK